MYYWATVFATFALGTALGDLTATTLHLGYLGPGIMFAVIITNPAIGWRMGLNPVAAFWFAYIVTRPLGASFADYFSKSRSLSGLGFGDLPTTAVFVVALAVLVGYLQITQHDAQPAPGEAERIWVRPPLRRPDLAGAGPFRPGLALAPARLAHPLTVVGGRRPARPAPRLRPNVNPGPCLRRARLWWPRHLRRRTPGIPEVTG